MQRRFTFLLVAIALGGIFLLRGAAPAATKVDFGRDIRPILSDNCFFCHGPDEKTRMVGLRLDTKEGAFAQRGANPVIVPGDASGSRLYQRLVAQNEAIRMPPKGSGKTLTAKQASLIKQWIDEGAAWTEHWSYVAPAPPDPAVMRNTAWVRNPIDSFVLRRLETEKLKPSPETDRATLLRRVTLDLTGLPPTPAEVDEFLADKSADGYEMRVDRLLASPAYGERMAMMWLDVSRYADTHGFHIDSHRDMWPWRDWVISAFNRNLPFDKFVVEQLAGDLLDNPTREQKVATGFNRNHMINYEGGAIPEEYHVEYVVDRVETTANAFLGMTMGCARCHDHKYDPISQRDFYRFFAFFNNVAEVGLDGRDGNAEPVLMLAEQDQQQRLDELTAQAKELEKKLSAVVICEAQSEWEAAQAATPGRDAALTPRNGLVSHYEFDGYLADTSGAYRHGRILRGEVTFADGRVARAASFSGETHVSLGDGLGFDKADPFTVALWFRPGATRAMTLLERAEGNRGIRIWTDDAQPIGDLRRGIHLNFSLAHEAPANALHVRTKERLRQDLWSHVTLSYDGAGRAAGVRLWIDGKPRELETVADNLSGSFLASAPAEIGNRLSRPYKGLMDDLRVYNRALSGPEIEQIAVHHPARVILSGITGRRPPEDQDRLREYFLTHFAPEEMAKNYAELIRTRVERAALEKAIPTTMVMRELRGPTVVRRESLMPRETFMLGRGDYRNKTERVTPGVPSALPPLKAGMPANRLGLARWLVDPSHPLTARVTVNRFWQMYFGNGLVKTTEDFGSQGESPSHPELLDWMATEFVRSGWDVKALQRLIVTSSVYRQSSRVSPALLTRDPENRLLARMSRFRVPAETVRDNALAASGLLNTQVGGPSVFPYQPKGLWEEIAYGDVFSAQTYEPSSGKDLYRRSMYSFWKRTSPPPMLATFDAPDREKCTAKRARTNTPLQSLALLNDPSFVEAARVLAERMIRDGGSDSGERINLGYRLATARKPSPRERQVLRDLSERLLADFRKQPDRATALLGVGESKPDSRLDPPELAAWTSVASVILNLDETITKE